MIPKQFFVFYERTHAQHMHIACVRLSHSLSIPLPLNIYKYDVILIINFFFIFSAFAIKKILLVCRSHKFLCWKDIIIMCRWHLLCAKQVKQEKIDIKEYKPFFVVIIYGSLKVGNIHLNVKTRSQRYMIEWVIKRVKWDKNEI